MTETSNVIEFSLESKEGKVIFRRKTSLEDRMLIYYKELCVGCGICFEVCPSDCIELNPISATRGVAPYPSIVIDPEKCYLCGICNEVCFFNALKLFINGEEVKYLEGSPRYALIYEIDESKCKPDCKECELACPRDAIKCISKVERDEEKCVYCTACKLACPEGAIVVEKVFSGSIELDLEKCQACGVCVDVCPTKALIMQEPEFGKEVEKLSIMEERCIYCKACANACPLDAISVVRSRVNYVVAEKSPWTKTHEEAFKRLAKGDSGGV